MNLILITTWYNLFYKIIEDSASIFIRIAYRVLRIARRERAEDA